MSNKCPNCGAEMQETGNKLICNYCDTEIVLKKEENTANNTQTQNEKKVYEAKKLFNIGAITDKRSLESFREMCAWINSEDTVESFMETINCYARKNSDFCTETVNGKNFRNVGLKVKKQFTPGEKALLYVNTAIMSNGKYGFLITNEAIYVLKRAGITKTSYKNLHSLLTNKKSYSYVTWYVNGNKKLDLYYLGGGSDPKADVKFGVIMGLMCTLARDSNPEGYKITVGEIPE